MQPAVVLVQQPAIDFPMFLGVSNKMLGYSLSSRSDASRKQQPDAAKYISCLAAMRDPKAESGLTPNLLNFVSFAVLIAADERDLLGILEAAGGMPFVQAETITDGAHLAVVSGTLSQWRDAVKTGASMSVEQNVRRCFCKIKELFDQVGLSDTWKDYTSKAVRDGTFLLEDKRK
jgi:hypothetical protein